MMMYKKMKASERNTNTLSRFFEMVRRTDSRRSGSDVDFYTRSAMPALLTMQSCFKQEQL